MMIWALAGATLTRCGRPATVAAAARRRRTSVCALGPWSCTGTGNGADATSAKGAMEVTGAWYGSRADGSGVGPSGWCEEARITEPDCRALAGEVAGGREGGGAGGSRASCAPTNICGSLGSNAECVGVPVV